MKLRSLSVISVLTSLLASCTLAPQPPAPQPEARVKEKVKTEVTNLEGEQQRQLDAMRERLASQNDLEKPPEVDPTSAITPTDKPKPKTGYPFATPVPGKEGFVFNPYTNNRVDVRDIPRGTLVRDPHDADPSHKFRVP